MDRESWWATVHEITKSDVTERVAHSFSDLDNLIATPLNETNRKLFMCVRGFFQGNLNFI